MVKKKKSCLDQFVHEGPFVVRAESFVPNDPVRKCNVDDGEEQTDEDEN